MKLLVICNELQKNEFLLKLGVKSSDILFTESTENLDNSAEVLFDLLFENTQERIAALRCFLPRPVIINSVATTLKEMDVPFIRINGWTGFINRPVLEFVVLPSQQAMAKAIFDSLDWAYQLLPDEPGFVSARIVAMIVNEAFYTFGDGIASRQSIDLAMELGTNYPKGPFSWAAQIGIGNIVCLLQALNKKEVRYTIAPALLAMEP